MRGSQFQRFAGVAASAALVAGLAAPATAQGPPFGTPPGLAKQGASAPAAAPAAAPPSAAPAAAPSTRGRASAPGRLKAAPNSAVSARAVQTTSTSTTQPIAVAAASTPAATEPAAAPSPAATATRPAARRAARRRAAHRAARRRAASRAAVRPAAVVAQPLAAAVPARVAPAPARTTRPAAKKAPQRRHPVAASGHARSDASITRTITREVRDIVEVFPAWAKAVIGGLALLLLLAGALVASAALRNRRLRRQRATLLEEVGVLQEALLPRVPDRVGALAVSVAYRPAEGLAAGGDFYDVFTLENGSTAIIVGDVSGHGRESLAPATFIRHMVRSYLEAGLPPRAALQLAGNVLDDQDRDDFATIVAAVYAPAAGTLSYATAGHPPPIITGPASYEPLTVASSPPAGVGVTTGLRQTTIAVPPGSSVCFFTDGLIEARDGSRYFGRSRLEEVVQKLGPEAAAQDVIDEVARLTSRFCDDIAMCVIRVDDGAAGGTVRVEEIEVTLSDLHTARLRRFFEACGVRPSDAATATKTAAPHVAGLGSVLLRVRLAADRSGVDVVPVALATDGADVLPVSHIR